MNIAKGYRNMLFAHAQKSADTNDQGAYITGLVDKNVIDIADLIVGGIIDSLLVEVGHGGPGGHFWKILADPEAIGAGCCAKAATPIPIANTVAAVVEMTFLMFCSLLRDWACGAATLDAGSVRNHTCQPVILH